MSELEGFIKRSNPDAYERWTIWHKQSLLTHEQVVNSVTRLMPTRAGFVCGALNGVFRFKWPLESADVEGGLDRYLMIEREDTSDIKYNRWVISLSTWHFDFIKLTEDDLHIISQPSNRKQCDWYKSKERLWEPWRFKHHNEDWK